MDSPDLSPPARFGAQLRDLRLRAGLSVRRLANELHRAHSGIVEYERGVRLPAVEVVEQYEDYFELPRGTLVAERERARAEGLERPPDGTVDEHLGDVACPYKGLRPFEPEDAALFFGRERQIEEILDRLAATRFVAVVGASGSGKSSFVRAGLLASLGSTASVPVALLTPGAHPLAQLADAVGPACTSSMSEHDLRADPAALVRATAGGGPLAIVVDQFEELFTLCDDEDERRCFVEALVGAWRDPSSPVVLMLALRADFYGRVAAYPELAAAVVAHQALIGPMGTGDMRRAIELPAASSGLLLQPGLVDTMLEDLAGEPGSLPLLSHALLETWKRRRRLQLTVGGYREAGGVRGAIAQTAERTLLALPEADREVARSIFLSLTDVDEGAEPTGRRVALVELAARRSAGDRIERVLGVLADARLVTIDERTVAVAHEALIRHWPRLRGWIEADRAGLVVHRRLQQAAREWDGLARDPGAVYRGPRLAVAEEWGKERPDDLSALERDFLQAGRTAERRTTQRRRMVLGAVTAALGISVVFGIVAYLQGRSARSQAFAARAIDTAKSDPEEGVRLALQAAELDRSSLVERALRESIAAAGWIRILRGEPRLSLNDATLSADGTLAVTGDDGGVVSVWDVRSGRRVATMHHPGTVRTAHFSANGERIVSAGDDGVARIWDRTGRGLHTLRPGAGAIRTATFLADGRILTATADGGAQVWVPGRRGPAIRLRATGVDPVDVTSSSSDGGRVLTVGRTSELRVWTLGPRPRFETLRARSDRQAGFTVGRIAPDGSHVLAGDDAGRTCLWRLRPLARTCHAQASTITDAAFSRDGALFTTASADGTAVVRRTADGRRVAVLEHGGGAIATAAFNPAGTRLVTAGQDRVARVWALDGRRRPERELVGHTDRLIAARFSGDGARVLTGSDDGSARVWPVRPDVGSLPGGLLPEADVAFSPDSRRLLAANDPGRAAIWDLRGGRRIDLRGGMLPNDAGLAPCDRVTGCRPWSSDSRAVVGARADGHASVWDVATGSSHAIGDGDATGAAFDRDARRLAIVRIAGPALVVDRAGERRISSAPRGARSPVVSARFTPDGRRLLTVDVDGNVVLSDPERGTPAGPRAMATLAGATDMSSDGSLLAVGTRAGALEVRAVHGGPVRATAPQGVSVTSVAFDHDGRRIVTAHSDRSARVWNVDALGDPPVVLRGHDAALLGAEFSPDGRFVLTSGSDGRVQLWDPGLGTSILVLPGSEQGRARFSPDSRLIAIGGRRTVEIYACELCKPFEDLIELARTRLPAD